jgi:hypothetical protein
MNGDFLHATAAGVYAGRERQGKAKVFFSEEKKQKTFVFCASVSMPAMAGNVGAAET